MSRNTLFAPVDIFAILAVVVPFSVYLLTLAPSVTFFDSGEFIAAVSSLGSAHSPGYPLFINYAKPFTFLPFGDIAFRVNIATALSASLACLGVYLLTIRLLAGQADRLGAFLARSSGLAAALAFAFSPRLWLQSNHDKPYPLLAFMAALIFLLLLRWRAEYAMGEERPGRVYLGAFVCGLAMGAHQTMVLLVPSFAILILLADPKLVTRVKEQILSLASFCLGFIGVYLHQPIRATRDPLMNWGDVDTLSRFLWHFLRMGYPTERVDRDLVLFMKQLAAFNIVHEFTAAGFFLLLVGAVTHRKQCRDFIIAFGAAVLVFLAFIVGYQNTPEETIFLTEEFFTPIYMLTAVFIGLGIFSLSRSLADIPRLRGAPALWLLLLFLMAALPASQGAANYRSNDQHDNYLARDYAVNTFRSLPEGAALFTWGDSGAFPLWYLQGVEGMRRDLLLPHVPHLQFDWYLDSFNGVFRESILRNEEAAGLPLRDILPLAVEEQLPDRPVFIDFSTRYSVELPGFSLRQGGICYRVMRESERKPLYPDRGVWDNYSLRGILDGRLLSLDLDSVKALRIYAYSLLESGTTLLSLGMESEGNADLGKATAIEPGLREEARRILHEKGGAK